MATRSSAIRSLAALSSVIGVLGCGGGAAGQPDGQNAADAAPADAVFDGGDAAPGTCSSAGSACATLAPDPSIYASYRKDYYLDESRYPEASLQWSTPTPTNGGRFHIVGTATASGAVTDVRINGQSVSALLDGSTGTPLIEWYHVWPDPVVVGQPVWVAFHSRNASWDAPGATGAIEVATAGGVALGGTFPVQQTAAPLTYVTVTDDRSTLVIHARNNDSVPHKLNRLLVDGRDVLAAGIACVPDVQVGPGTSVMWTVPLCTAASLGDAWTVVADWDGTADAVAGGRYLRPFFPIEAWPTGGDCTMPGGDSAWLAKNLQAGFDTMYLYWGESCSQYSTQSIINTQAPAMAGAFNVLIGDDFRNKIENGVTGLISDFRAVAGLLTGDESDGELYVDGAPAPENKARQARWMWRNYPQVTIYNGAKTHKNIGTFAGMTDIQGIDLYVAACAPWITGTNPPPIRAAYDYLRNARNNQMPWGTWQYAQGVGTWKGQPNAAEVLVQAFSVMLAGGKGLMWFQSRKTQATANPDTWTAMARANRVFRGLREHLRIGDLTGGASSTGNVLVDMIRAREVLVVPVVNIGTSSGPDLASCGIASIGGPVPHWALVNQSVDVTLDIPDDFTVADAFEVLVDDSGNQIVNVAYPKTSAGRRVTYTGVPLSQATPVRVLVLATTTAVRARVAAAMAN